jgi:hypothetical protein
MKHIKKERKPTEWTMLLKKTYAAMKAKDPSIKLKDAMKEAKKVYRK